MTLDTSTATRLVNLTQHTITLYAAAGAEVLDDLPSHGKALIVDQQEEVVGTLLGMPVVSRSLGRLEGLPAAVDGTVYIVSLFVQQHRDCASRSDLVSPDTSKSGSVRGEDGQVIGTRGFVVVPRGQPT